MEYPKIETLYERDEKFKVDPSKLKNRTYSLLKTWHWTEKIDGTNMRAIWDGEKLSFNGRTNNALIPGDLLKYMYETVSAETFKSEFQGTPVVIYGEGYGAGIQKGGSLSPTKKFIVFDVLVDNKWWLSFDNVEDVCRKFNLDVVPFIGNMTLEEATDFVSKGFVSALGEHPMAEGLVGRPLETLFDAKGSRLITKLKTKDFGAPYQQAQLERPAGV